jgi:hypothetical protein
MMAYGKLVRTQYEGVYTYKDKHGRKVFVACFMLDRKLHRKTIGYEGDKYAMTAKKAFVIKEEMKQRVRNGEYQAAPKSRTFDCVFEAYFESVTPIENKKTIENKCYNYRKHIKPYLPNSAINALDTAFWQQLINRALKADLAPSTAAKIKNTIKKVYDYAISRQWATKNPAIEIRLPKYDDRVEVDLTLDEYKKLYQTIINYPPPPSFSRHIYLFATWTAAERSFKPYVGYGKYRQRRILCGSVDK